MGSKKYNLGTSYLKQKRVFKDITKDVTPEDDGFILTVEVTGMREMLAQKLLALMEERL